MKVQKKEDIFFQSAENYRPKRKVLEIISFETINRKGKIETKEIVYSTK
jgi:hypothetical protein